MKYPQLWQKRANIIQATIIYIFLLLMGQMDVFAQKAQPKSKADKTLDNVNEMIDIFNKGSKTLFSLINESKRTREEFNKTVKVKKQGEAPAVPTGSSTSPKFKKGQFQNFKWEPVAYFDNQLFPSVIISMANYKGEVDDQLMNSIKSSALGIRFLPQADFIPIRWEIESVDKNYFDKVSGDFMMENRGQELYFMPNVPWNMAYLAKHITSSPINVVYRLFDEEGQTEERSVPLFMRSVNDCVFLYKGKPLFFMFTAYIQEQHPEVDVMLKEALKSKMVNAFTGYQGDEASVHRQVAAIWKVLYDRGFQYSSITTTATNSTEQLASQQVRTFDMALKSQQANCVDGSVMLCSILRAINISTFLVIVPGHCFMGYYTSGKRDKIAFVETTLMSDDEFLAKAKTPAEKQQAYLKQFEKARASGIETYNQNKAQGKVTLVDVDGYRSYIRPLPF